MLVISQVILRGILRCVLLFYGISRKPHSSSGAVHVGLRSPPIDMTLDTNNPAPRSKHTCACTDKTSAFQKILHAIGSATGQELVHKLDLFKY